MILGVSVVKAVTWRGIEEEFTNVWHYDASVDTTAESVADAVVDEEKKVFGPNVTFKKVQVWGPADGTALQSQMLVQKDLTGTGTTFPGAVLAKELTAVISWDTGRVNTRGGRIFLRKYLHLGQWPFADEDQAKGNTLMPVNQKTEMERFGNAMKNLVGVAGANICDKKGRKLPLNTGAVCLPHLHTRQFRR
jgi:hypothetical protein